MNQNSSITIADNLVLSIPEFKLFQSLIYKHAGIHLSDRKHALVQGRLKRRLAMLQLPSYHAYYKHIQDPANSSEFQECLNALTTNETYFFRHKNHWDYLLQTIVPSWKQASPRGRLIRVWSAACSSGEEPYSAAIALYDSLSQTAGWKISIHATDINEEVLHRARTGVYDHYAVQKLTPLCIDKYLRVTGSGQYIVRDEIKRLVDFRLHNLLQRLNGLTFDVVFLRNVMIYFDEDSKRTVISHVADQLKAGGYLFLGGAETLSVCHDRFEYLRPTIYRKLR